jgi:hypothetical protein
MKIDEAVKEAVILAKKLNEIYGKQQFTFKTLCDRSQQTQQQCQKTLMFLMAHGFIETLPRDKNLPLYRIRLDKAFRLNFLKHMNNELKKQVLMFLQKEKDNSEIIKIVEAETEILDLVIAN